MVGLRVDRNQLACQALPLGTEGSGTVIAELYDATPAGTFSATTPRLVNVSVLKQIATGETLTAGFVIGGTTAKTVLIRAIGPALGFPPFNIGGAMPDPELTLVNTSASPPVTVAANNDWGGASTLNATIGRVGAFAVNNFASKDAMDIRSFGDANVRKFFALGYLKNIPGIYALPYDKIGALEGYGEKSVSNLQSAIETSRGQPLHRLIYGLGIRYVGETTAKILARRMGLAQGMGLAYRGRARRWRRRLLRFSMVFEL